MYGDEIRYMPATYNCAQFTFKALRDSFDLAGESIFRSLASPPAIAGLGLLDLMIFPTI